MREVHYRSATSPSNLEPGSGFEPLNREACTSHSSTAVDSDQPCRGDLCSTMPYQVLLLVRVPGIEPGTLRSEGSRLPLSHTLLVNREGIEPSYPPCHDDVLPLN